MIPIADFVILEHLLYVINPLFTDCAYSPSKQLVSRASKMGHLPRVGFHNQGVHETGNSECFVARMSFDAK